MKEIDEEALRKRMTPQQFNICRGKGTEPPFTGKYWDHHEQGTYHCAVCEAALFGSEAKFESGSGWPSFYQPLGSEQVNEHRDSAHGMVRTEVVCSSCGSHLGHVFADGPKPTGLRYCINSASLAFRTSTS